jgi:hypothetical protein
VSVVSNTGYTERLKDHVEEAKEIAPEYMEGMQAYSDFIGSIITEVTGQVCDKIASMTEAERILHKSFVETANNMHVFHVNADEIPFTIQT